MQSDATRQHLSPFQTLEPQRAERPLEKLHTRSPEIREGKRKDALAAAAMTPRPFRERQMLGFVSIARRKKAARAEVQERFWA
jgi:hypothetical protein